MPKTEKGGLSPHYRVFETKQFLVDLSHLGPVAQKRLEGKLRNFVYPILRHNPHFGPNIRRLKNWEPPAWRYRVGNWRFCYEIEEKQAVVSVIAADHRK